MLIASPDVDLRLLACAGWPVHGRLASQTTDRADGSNTILMRTGTLFGKCVNTDCIKSAMLKRTACWTTRGTRKAPGSTDYRHRANH